MKLVFCHNRIIIPAYTMWFGDSQNRFVTNPEVSPCGGSTVAMEAIQSWLLDTIEVGSTIVRKVGVARCSDEDNYCKKIGRELAQSRLKSTTLKVVNKVKIGEFVIVFFEDETGNLFEVKKSSDPHCARLVRMLDE